jgi:hypothetical protein
MAPVNPARSGDQVEFMKLSVAMISSASSASRFSGLDSPKKVALRTDFDAANFIAGLGSTERSNPIVCLF